MGVIWWRGLVMIHTLGNLSVGRNGGVELVRGGLLVGRLLLMVMVVLLLLLLLLLCFLKLL